MEGVAAERTLRFLVKIDADLDEAERALQELRALLQSIDQTNAEAAVNVDGIEHAIEQVRQLQQTIESLDGTTIEINADVEGAIASLRNVEQVAQDVAQTYTIHIDVDDQAALATLREFAAQAKAILDDIEFSPIFDDDTASQQIRAFNALAEAMLSDKQIELTVDVGTAMIEVERLKEAVGGISDEHVNIRIDTDLSEIEELRIALNHVSEMSAYARIGVIKTAMADETIRDLEARLRDYANNEYEAKLTLDASQAYREIQQFQREAHVNDVQAELDVQDIVGLAKIRHFKEQLAEIERVWTAILDVDNKSGLSKIRYFLGRVQQVDEAMGTAHLAADGVPAEVTINNITNNVKEYGRMRASAKLGVETAEARAELAGFQTILSRYENRWGGTKGIRARITADISQALVNIRLLNSLLEHEEDNERRIIIEAEITKAMAELETLRSFASEVGAQDPTVTVGVRGVATSIAEMLGLQAVADRLDGTNATINLDIDDRLSRALPNILGAFELQLQKFQTIATTAAAVGVQSIIASLAAIPGVAAAAAGAVGSLTTAIVPGLVGAAAALGGAIGGSAVALGVFGLAVKSAGSFTWGLSQNLRQQAYQTKAAKDAMTEAQKVLDSTTKGTQAYENAQNGLTLATINYNNEAQNNKILLESVTPTIIKLARKYADLSNQVTRLKASMADAVAPFLIVFFNAISGAITKITPGLHNMISAMGDVAASFVKSYQSGIRLQQITTVLQSIADIGPNAMKILTNGLDIFIGLAAQVMPTSAKLVSRFAELSTAANNWVHSAEGQNRIAEIWQHMWQVAQQLWRISLNLAKGLWGVVQALSASSTGTWLLDQIEKGSKWFADLMSASGDARNAITQFVNDTKPLLVAAGELLAEVAKGVLHLIQVVRNERGESGKPFGILIDVLNALKQTVPEVVELLVHEFRQIGPLLPGLIKEIGEWATLFQRSTPEMIVFVKALTGMLHAFNSLPEPVKIAIARTLAWAAAIKVLGGGALLGIGGSIATAVAHFIAYRRIMSRLPGDTSKAAGSFTRLRSLFSTLASAGSAALAKLRPIFEDLALRGMYAMDKLKAAFARLPGILSQAASSARAGVGRIVAALRPVGTAVRGAFAGVGGAEAAVAGGGLAALLGGWYLQIKQFREDTLPTVEKWGPDLAAGIKRGMQTGNFSGVWDPLGEIVGEIARLPFQPAEAVTRWLLEPVEKAIENWTGIKITWPWEQRANNIENSIKAIKGIGPRIGAIVRGIGTIIGNAWNGIRNNAGPIWNSIKQTAINAWNGIKSGIVGAVRTIWPIIAPIWQTIKNGVLAAWNGLKGAASSAWQGIKNAILGAVRAVWPAIAPIWQTVKNGVLAAWNGLKSAASAAWNAIKTVIRVVVYTTVGLILMAWDRIKPGLLRIWNGIKSAAVSAWNGIKNAIRAAWNGVKAIFGPVLNFIKNLVQGAWNAIKSRTTAIWNGIKNFLRGVWNAIKGIFQGSGALSRIVQAAWQRIRNTTTAIWNGIKNFLRGVWNGIKGIAGPAINAIRNAVRNGWNTIKNITTTVWNAVRNAVRNAWNAIKGVAGPAINAIRNAVRNGWNGIRNLTTQVWNAIKNFLRNTWNQIKQIAGPAINAIRNAVRNGWNSIKQLTTQVWGAIRNFLRNVWNQIKQIAGPAINAIRNAVRNGWNSIKQLTSQVWGAIRNFFRSVWNQIKAVVQPAVNAIRNAVQRGWQAVRNTTTSIWNGIRNFFRSAWNQIKAVVAPAVNAIRNTVQQGWNAIKNTTTSVWNAIKNFVQSVWSQIRSVVISAINAVRNAVVSGMRAIHNSLVSAWQGVVNVVRSAWTSIRNAVSSGLSSVVKLLGQYVHNFYVMGHNLIVGLINGIKSQAGAVGTAIGNLLVDAYNRGKQAIESRSPSKLFHRGIGETVPQGIASGIAARARDVFGAITAMTRSMFERTRQGIEALHALGRAAIQAGHMIVAGLTRGVGEASAQLIARMRQIAQAALNAARSTLQVHSPSRPMVSYGIDTIKGLIVGAARMFGPLRDTIMRLLQTGVFGPIDDAEPRDLGELVSTAAGLRQQTRQAQTMVRTHRMVESSYTRMVKTMMQGSRAATDAMRSMEMQMRRNAQLQASMGRANQQQNQLTVQRGVVPQARLTPQPFHATPPQETRATRQRSAATVERIRHDVYIHTDGPGAGELDNQDLADRITQNLHRERRRN